MSQVCTSEMILKGLKGCSNRECPTQPNNLLAREPSAVPLVIELNQCPRMGWDWGEPGLFSSLSIIYDRDTEVWCHFSMFNCPSLLACALP